jgi:hypothetical protein
MSSLFVFVFWRTKGGREIPANKMTAPAILRRTDWVLVTGAEPFSLLGGLRLCLDLYYTNCHESGFKIFMVLLAFVS